MVGPTGFEVRRASVSDVAALAELDRQAFAGLGMGHYGESYVRCWLEVNPEGLLVASRDGVPVACCYSQYVDFSPETVPQLTTDAAFTDAALTRKTHRPDGNSIHVVTVSSIVPGGRRALFAALLRQMSAQKRSCLLLFSRLAGLSHYFRMLEEQGIDVAAIGREHVVREYVTRCASWNGGARIWPALQAACPMLPTPTAADPVLNKYLKDPGAVIAATLLDWIEDPASCNCSALVIVPNR
jgi:hypothetical protein